MDNLTRYGSRRYLVAAAAAALLSALIVFAYLRGVTARVAQHGRLVELVVAARDLQGGEVLDSSSLQLIPFPDRYLLPGTYTDPEQVFGRRLYRPLREGEPVLESALLPGGWKEVLESLTEGFRAFPIPQEAVDYPFSCLPPQGRVDILFKEGDPARLGLENVRVLGTTTTSGSDDSTWEAAGSASPSEGCLLVEVTAEEACRLAAALRDGGVEIILRPRGE